jgi:zinc transporter ZupT
MNDPEASAVSIGNEAKIGVLTLTVLLAGVTVLGTSLVAAWTYPNSPNMTPPIVDFALGAAACLTGVAVKRVKRNPT